MAIKYLWVADDLTVGSPGTWTDRIAGEALTFTAGATTATVTAVNGAHGGAKVVTWPTSCTSYWQKTTFTAGALAQDLSIHILGSYDGGVDQACKFVDGGGGNRCVIYQDSTANGRSALYAGSVLGGTDGTTDFSSDLSVITGVFDNTSSALWVNNSEVLTGTAGSGSINGITIGAGYTGADFLEGTIRAVAISDAPTTDRFKIDNLLAWIANGAGF